jgi:hypothetical protein
MRYDLIFLLSLVALVPSIYLYFHFLNLSNYLFSKCILMTVNTFVWEQE